MTLKEKLKPKLQQSSLQPTVFRFRQLHGLACDLVASQTWAEKEGGRDVH